MNGDSGLNVSLRNESIFKKYSKRIAERVKGKINSISLIIASPVEVL